MDAQPSPPRAAQPAVPGWPAILVLIALLLVLALAGIPGSERSAGDGSGALRHGWAAQRAREAGWTADEVAAPELDVPPDAPTTPR